MKHTDKLIRLVWLCLILSLFILAGGCGSVTRQEGNLASFAQANEIPLARGMAADLCVANEDVIPRQDLEHVPDAAGLFSLTDHQVLYAKNIHRHMQPASITKLLTALVALKYGNLSDPVQVSDNVLITEWGAKLCGFVPGEEGLTLEDALYGLLVYSGNDAGVVVAEHLAGSVEAFAEMMNREARAIGATQTHFVNPHGLTAENHYTTIYDLYLIFSKLMEYPKFMEIIQTRSYTYTRKSTGEKLVWDNTNWFFTGEAKAPEGVAVIGGKTGTTSAAGACLLLLSTQESTGKQYISVVMNAPDRPNLYLEMSDLLNEINRSGL